MPLTPAATALAPADITPSRELIDVLRYYAAGRRGEYRQAMDSALDVAVAELLITEHAGEITPAGREVLAAHTPAPDQAQIGYLSSINDRARAPRVDAEDVELAMLESVARAGWAAVRPDGRIVLTTSGLAELDLVEAGARRLVLDLPADREVLTGVLNPSAHPDARQANASDGMIYLYARAVTNGAPISIRLSVTPAELRHLADRAERLAEAAEDRPRGSAPVVLPCGCEIALLADDGHQDDCRAFTDRDRDVRRSAL
jgi:hypothetical protein